MEYLINLIRFTVFIRMIRRFLFTIPSRTSVAEKYMKILEKMHFRA